MRYSTKPLWRKRFAVLPVTISNIDIEVWLEWYWALDWRGNTHTPIETRLLENPPPNEAETARIIATKVYGAYDVPNLIDDQK